MKSFFSMIMVATCLFGLTINNAFAQTESTTVEKQYLAVQSGENSQGEIVDNDNEYLISSLINEDTSQAVNENESSLYQFKNHSKTNYFISPSFIPLEKGEVSLRNIMLTNNNLSYGLTKHISISGGFEAISLYNRKPTWNVASKIGFEAFKNVHIGGGFNYRANGFYDLSLVYGGLTFGDENRNITLGVGSDFQKGKLFEKPAFSLCGMFRLSDNLLIVSENYMVDKKTNNEGYQYMGIQGMRYMGKGGSLDAGIMIARSDSYWFGGLYCLPYVGCKLNISELLKK